MIEELTLRNIGVIERAELAFSPGLTAITGETGAGKTMILTGLGLLTGTPGGPGPGARRPGAGRGRGCPDRPRRG
jgi:DNA replication and repair protein RecN